MSQPGVPEHDPAPGERPVAPQQGSSLSLRKGGGAPQPTPAPPEEQPGPQGLPPDGGQLYPPPGQPFPEAGQQLPQGQQFPVGDQQLPPGGQPFPEGQFPPGGQPYPAGPAQFPPQGQQFPQGGQQFPGDQAQFPPPGVQPHPQYGQPWPPQQQPRKGRGGLIALVLVFVLVVLAGGAAGAYFLFFEEDPNKKPAVDTSLDLADAPMGCGIFTEAELAPFIPGTFTTEPTDVFGGDKDYEKSAQCSFSNQKTHTAQRQPAVWVIVTTKLLKANQNQSGVQKAKTELGRKPGSAVGIPGADDDRFREIKSSNNNISTGEMSFIYHNVFISITYHYERLGQNKFTQPLMQMSTKALEKVTG